MEVIIGAVVMILGTVIFFYFAGVRIGKAKEKVTNAKKAKTQISHRAQIVNADVDDDDVNSVLDAFTDTDGVHANTTDTANDG